MKITIELDVDTDDIEIFKRSLSYFLWNNPSSLSVDSIEIDYNKINWHTLRTAYINSTNVSLQRIEEFKHLIYMKYE